MLDLLVAVEDEVVGLGVLAQLAVHPRLEPEGMRVGDLVCRHEPWPYGAVGVERLSHRHGRAAELPVAHADVVDDRVAGDDRRGSRRGDVPAAPPDDEPQLALVVDDRRGARDVDRLSRTDDAARLLVEPQLHLGLRGARLGDVGCVVQAYREELGRPGDRCGQPDGAQRQPRTVDGAHGVERIGAEREESGHVARQVGAGGGDVDDLVAGDRAHVQPVRATEGHQSHGILLRARR